MSFYAVDELIEASSSSVRNSFLELTERVAHVFGNEYLRHPNKEDLKRILAINDGRRFPVCVGSFDFQKWLRRTAQ